MRITVGDDRLRYSQDAGTLVIEAKLLLNCTDCTITVDNGVRFLAVDIKDFLRITTIYAYSFHIIFTDIC